MYLPVYQDQINPFDPLGGLGCTNYSFGMGGDFDTLGNVHPSGRQVRALCRNPDGTKDVTGGTTLVQNDAALRNGWGVDLDTEIGVGAARPKWTDFVRRINAGQGAVLQGSYRVIDGTRFDAGGSFRGNHAMFVAPGFIVLDPLADGRRPGIYKYHGEPYPVDLLRRFAGDLELTPGGSRLGLGFAWASFTRDHVATPPKYRATVPKGEKFWLYALDKAGTRVLSRKLQTTGGFSASCEGPRWYPWAGHGNVRLVRLTSGVRKGSAIVTHYADEV